MRATYQTTVVPVNQKCVEGEVARIANELVGAGREVVAVFTIPETSGLDGPGTSGQWFRVPAIGILHRVMQR